MTDTRSPYSDFVQVLSELYAGKEKYKIETPKDISNGDFDNLHYQIDAVRQGLDCLEKYSGVIIADVVGLGKSIIAATIAYNAKLPRVVIITPPHLKPQWENYAKSFGLQNVIIETCGKIDRLYDDPETTRKTTLYIIDEAHRYRNEETDAYRILHQLTRAQANNKVILLTATPYNNHPRDLYALVKLFQIPSRSTLNVVDNLGLRFSKLIAEYNQLELANKKRPAAKNKKAMERIARDLKMIIAPIMIRRSRIDLAEIEDYAEDLARQNVSLAKLNDPISLNYDLGELATPYYNTLREINEGKFQGAKYKPLLYLKNAEEFKARYKKVFNFNQTQQLNMAKLARRLFVLRFESSQYAFKATLENMIKAHAEVLRLWDEEGLVSVSQNRSMENLDGGQEKNLLIECKMINAQFREDVEADLAWLKMINEMWFQNDSLPQDPKLNEMIKLVKQSLKENPEKKIVIFTTFADTAKYVADELKHSGLKRTLYYASTTNQGLKNKVVKNFDAALDESKQMNDFDIIVATDALSEGFNLHRAGIVINYDIPYNPTRVIQRIGRVNRIDQQKFERLGVYNLFPTTVGENIINVKGISSLKLWLMNQTIGNDMKVLTSDERVASFAMQQLGDKILEDERSWDNDYYNIYNAVKNDLAAVKPAQKNNKIRKLVRKKKVEGWAGLVVLKRGKNLVFMGMNKNGDYEIILPEIALKLLEATPEEKAEIVEDKKGEKRLRRELAKPYELAKMYGKRGYALDVVEALREIISDEKTKLYLEKLYNVLRKYDDLCEAELRYITQTNLDKINLSIKKLQQVIPEWYLDAVTKKAEKVEAAKTKVLVWERFEA